MKIERWLKLNTESLCGKRVAITGSTGGLGKALSAYLAAFGASLVLLDRNRARSEAHRDALTARFPGIDVSCITLDMEDLSSAARAVELLQENPVDILIHNAGAYSIPRHKCASGYDNVFQINFATPYYLIRGLLPSLRACKGRVVVVGSIAHRFSKIDVDDIDFSRRRAASRIYGNAKRYLIFALQELFRDEHEATLAVAHPGITPTNITAHYPRWIGVLIKYPMQWIFMPPKKAALATLRGVFEATEYGTWLGPACFDIWGFPKKRRLYGCSVVERALIASTAEQVYRVCCEVTNQEKAEDRL